jgi:hypothetical protein
MLIQVNSGNMLPYDVALVLVDFVNHLLGEISDELRFVNLSLREAIGNSNSRHFSWATTHCKSLICAVMAINVVIIGWRVFQSQENIRHVTEGSIVSNFHSINSGNSSVLRLLGLILILRRAIVLCFFPLPLFLLRGSSSCRIFVFFNSSKNLFLILIVSQTLIVKYDVSILQIIKSVFSWGNWG